MKSILVFADSGPAMPRRTQAALDVARTHKAHITFLIVNPYSSYIALDPMGGVYVASASLQAIQEERDELGDKIAAEMANEDIGWDIIHMDGEAVPCIIDAARFADLVIVSLGSKEAGRKPHSLLNVHDLMAHSRCPVLAVPDSDNRFVSQAKAAIAWNGSHEAANAVKAALPMLKQAASVHIISIDKEDKEEEVDFPATALSQYLSRHDIGSELHNHTKTVLSVEEILDMALANIQAKWLVMGAYGHSRMRETLMGGVTKYFLDDSNIPLIMAH